MQASKNVRLAPTPYSDKSRTNSNISFAHNVKEALDKYCKDNGLPNVQDAVRLFVAAGLRQSGHLK